VTDDDRSIIERWLAAGDAGDLDVFDEILHPDVRVHAPLGLSTTGIEGEKRVWRDARAAIPDLKHELQEVIAEGGSVSARVIVTGTLQASFGGVAASGGSFRIDQLVFAHVRDGRAVEIWELVDTASLPQGEGSG
jgi:predicted ester cyclase